MSPRTSTVGSSPHSEVWNKTANEGQPQDGCRVFSVHTCPHGQYANRYWSIQDLATTFMIDCLYAS